MALKEPEPQAEGVHPKNKRPRKGMPPSFKKKGEKQKDDGKKEKGQGPKGMTTPANTRPNPPSQDSVETKPKGSASCFGNGSGLLLGLLYSSTRRH